MDPVTGGILGYLYPDADVHVKGFQTFPAGAGSSEYDLIVGNPPFGNYRVA